MNLPSQKKCCILIVFLLVHICYGQDKLKLKRGEIIDSINIPSLNHHFSIYLPRSFDMSKKWPVIIGFDSSGNCNTLTKLYKNAAEEFGYVVMVTNILEDQDEKDKFNYAATFIRHVFSVFPLQKDRVYLTGLENDARFISLLPVFFGKDISGVVTIGDSYFYNSIANIGKNCAHIGIIHENNYRQKYFFENHRYLSRKAIAADVLVYDGETKLPDQELIKKTLSTFTLQAMLKGRITTDSVWVKKVFEKDLLHVQKYLNEKKFLYAFNEIKRIRNTYQLFFDTNYLKEKQKVIRQSKGYRSEKRLHKKNVYKEDFLKLDYSFAIEEDIEGERYKNLGWWKYQIAELDTLTLSKEKSTRFMAYRVKGYLKYLIEGYKEIQPEGKQGFEKVLFLNILSTILNKKDFDSYLKIISMAAKDRDFETSLFYLEEMLKNGYQDFESLYTIEGTIILKTSNPYNELIQKYLGKSKFLFSN